MVEFPKMQRVGQMMGWGDNDIYKGFDRNRMALMQGFAGLGADPMNPLGGFTQGFANGAMLDMANQKDAEAEAKEQEAQNATMEWLQSQGYDDLVQMAQATGDIGAAWSEGLKRSNPTAGGDSLMSVGGHLYDTATGQWISPPQTAENRQNVSLTPQWAQDENGNWVMLQTSSTGELVQSQMPEGLTLADPRMLNAEKSAGTTFGKSVAGAQFDLPSAQLTRDQTLQAIQDVRNQRQGMEEQFGNVMGIPQQMTPAWPGSPKANFQVTVERATNRAFMEARQMLKGGGQITDFESRKAEAAITAMQSAMEKGDKTLFLQSLDDFERAVSDGYAKLEQQAGMLPQTARQPVMAPATSSGNGWTVIGVE